MGKKGQKKTKEELEKELKNVEKQLLTLTKAKSKAEALAKERGDALKAAKQLDSDDSSSSDSDSGDESKVAPKMEAPKTRYDGTASDWKSWQRTVKLWYNTRSKWASERTLGSLLMESIDGEAKDVVYSHVKEGKEKYGKIMKVLEDEYGLDAVLRTTDAITELRACKRAGGMSLQKHLKDYHGLRLTAIKEGLTPSQTDGVDLLASCDLAPQTHTNVLIQLGGDVNNVNYKQVRTLLKTIAKAEELKVRERRARGDADEPRGRKRGGEVLVADVSEEKRHKTGKGKWGGGKGSGAKGKGKGTGLCKFFLAGNCKFGADCWKSHESPSLFAGPKGQKGAGKFLAGDWECPKCKTHNFAKNETCFKKECGEKRPQGKDKGKKGAGKSGAGKAVT